MGIFISSNQQEEIDPAWQRRRQRLLILIAILSLGAAGALVFHLWRNKPPAQEGPDIKFQTPPVYMSQEEWNRTRGN